MKKRVLASLMAGMLILTTAAAADELVPAPELPPAEGGTLVTLTLEEDPKLGPNPDNYTFPEGDQVADSYADPSIAVKIGSGRYNKTPYFYARVKIAHPNQLRTFIWQSYRSEAVNTVVSMASAKNANAVVAINGDYCGGQHKYSAIIRQGVQYRLKLDLTDKEKENGTHVPDVLLIDDQGDLHILRDATNATIEAYLDSAVNVFTFGPGLIIDGEAQYGFVDRQKATHKSARRMAICQTGPLEYLLITSCGPEDPGSEGLKLDEFVALLESFGEIRNAYNLDGGTSASLVFRKGNGLQSQINAPKIRPIRDMIYFADAWIPDAE